MNRRSLLIVLVFAISACGARAKGPSLIDEIRAYNDGVRWRQYPKAAARVHPRERTAFVAELSTNADEVKISEWDLVHVERRNRGRKSAIAHVRYRWFRDSVGTLHSTNTVQTWKRHGRAWLVTAEKRVRGEPMPGIEEPDEDSEEDSKEDSKGEPEKASDKDAHTGGASPERAERGDKLTLRQMLFEFR